MTCSGCGRTNQNFGEFGTEILSLCVTTMSLFRSFQIQKTPQSYLSGEVRRPGYRIYWWNAVAKSMNTSTFCMYPAQKPSVHMMFSTRVKGVFRRQPGMQRQGLCEHEEGTNSGCLKTFSPHGLIEAPVFKTR